MIEVTRLGLLCGPAAGMLAGTRVLRGRLAESLESRQSFEGQLGDCDRVVAAAEPSVGDLEVEVLGPDGERLAQGNDDRPWIVAPAAGVFCVRRAGTHTLVLRAHAAPGEYAVQVWRLRRPLVGR